MAERDQPNARVDALAGHLTVGLDTGHSRTVMFAFEDRRSRMLPAFASAFGLEATVLAAFVLLSLYGPTLVSTQAQLPEDTNPGIVWLAQPGPGGGGGGGGNKMPDPPRVAELPGKEKISVPVQKPPSMEIKPKPQEPEPQVAQVNIPAVSLGASNDTLPGLIDAPSASNLVSLGSGSGGGAGTGTGTGIGPGQGSGLGPGSGGATGGGVYQPGNGVTTPVLLRKINPGYTPEAMRAKIQGSVVISCVVMPDGKVNEIQVVRSLPFGLDDKAIEAVRGWQFEPGKLKDQPVKVRIVIELTFTLR